ncbi:MAG TPA: TonB family protein [Rhizomicrobium sp.]|nr:TonB family protein [Rhizomicrobium sp.]
MSKFFLRMFFTLTISGFAFRSTPVSAQPDAPGAYDSSFPSANLYIYSKETDTSPAGTYDIAPVPIKMPVAMNAPIRLDTPHYCYLTPYLSSAIENGEEGSVDVDFTIGKDGRTKNAVVTWSSGWRDIDHVAIECVAKWTYQPATKNNEPVEASSKAKITIQMDFKGKNGSPEMDATVTRPVPKRFTQCLIPGSIEKLHPPMVAMTINTIGDVDNPTIEKSSGDPAADKIVLDCVKKWEFTPAMQFGRPVATRMRGAVRLTQNANP